MGATEKLLRGRTAAGYSPYNDYTSEESSVPSEVLDSVQVL